MILCIDIGNTNVVSAFWDGEKYVHENRIETKASIDEHFININFKIVSKIIISSVVPSLTHEYIGYLKKVSQINPFIINPNNSNLEFNVDFPDEVGADRICNSFAAKNLFGTPAIVIDFGSATTYDVINKKGVFIGGAIAPGIDVSANHLIQKTALLKSTAFQFPSKAIGKNTKTNLQSGIMFGGLDAINGMLKRIQNEMESDNINVILTGGFSSLISKELKCNHYHEPLLTLHGMRLINEKNNSL